MTQRSKIYFTLKLSLRLMRTAKGWQFLEGKSIYPIMFNISGSSIPRSQERAYMIDNKGGIVGTTIETKGPKKVFVNIPAPGPNTTKINFRLLSAEELI